MDKQLYGSAVDELKHVKTAKTCKFITVKKRNSSNFSMSCKIFINFFTGLIKACQDFDYCLELYTQTDKKIA